jgi:hypothetical protein
VGGAAPVDVAVDGSDPAAAPAGHDPQLPDQLRDPEGRPPPYATTSLPVFIYRNSFEYLRFGYAAATVVMLAVTAVLIAVQYAVLRRWRHARIV